MGSNEGSTSDFNTTIPTHTTRVEDTRVENSARIDDTAEVEEDRPFIIPFIIRDRQRLSLYLVLSRSQVLSFLSF